MKLDRQHSSKRRNSKLSIFDAVCSFFKTKYIIVNHHCCSYQVMYKKWYETDWSVTPLKNGVNHFYDIHDAIKWIDDGCKTNDDYITTVIWES